MAKHTSWLLLASLVIDAGAVAGGEASGPRADVDSPRLAALSAALKVDGSGVLETFWKEMQGKAPLIEPIMDDERHLRVTFLWRGDDKTKTVLLMGGLPAAALHKPLSRLGDTELWYRTERLPKTTRIAYAFRVNAPPEDPSGMDEAMGSMLRYPPRVDALNPNKHFMFSVLELPDAPPQPWIKARPDVSPGIVKVQAVDSAILGQKRDLVVYTPGGYENMACRCCLLVVFDAEAACVVPSPMDGSRCSGK